MKSWAMCLAALGLVCLSLGLGDAHIMSPDFVRKANKESFATHEKELNRKNDLRQDEKLRQQAKSMKKELEENERLEKKAMQNMSDDKLKEFGREKREAEKRAEMKTLIELKRLEKKFLLKSESGFNTELKSANKNDKKSHLMIKHLKKDMSHKQILEQELLEQKLHPFKSLKEGKVKHLKKSVSVKDKKNKLSKSRSGKILKNRSTDETILKHAPEYMKMGRNIEEKRALKKLRMRMKREAEVHPHATDTKAFLSMRPAGKLSKHSEEDQDYWSDGHDYMKKDAVDSPPPIAWSPDDDYNEVEFGDHLLEAGEADVAANEIFPVTEADEPELIKTSSSAPIEEIFTQPPILVTTGLPNPVVSTIELVEPYSASSDSESSSAELAAPPSYIDSVSYEVHDGLGEPDLTIVTLAPELPSDSSAPLLATFEPPPSTTPAVVSGTRLQESSETTTLPPTTTQFSGPWPWLNLGPGEESQCGQARFGPDSRIDGGQRRTLKILDGKEALPGSFPWQVAILDKDQDMLCGGTLIAPRWVLTAAHCIRKKLFVRLSEHHIHDKDGYEIEQKVRRVFRHPAYNSTTIDNDIALLRLPVLPSFPDSLSGVARVGMTDRACLPADQDDFPPVGTRCLVMGWGKASTTNSYGTDVLMYTRLPIISRKACIRANRKTITENMFCAGHYKGGSDTCSGDSGGPLLCSSGGEPSEETWTVYGVTSFGDGCGNAGKMGVYAKVNKYLGWVAGILRKY